MVSAWYQLLLIHLGPNVKVNVSSEGKGFFALTLSEVGSSMNASILSEEGLL